MSLWISSAPPPENPSKNRVEGLNSLVAQAAQVASAHPESVRSTLLDTGEKRKSFEHAAMTIKMCVVVHHDVISEPSRPQKELRIAVSDLSCCGNVRPAPLANLKMKIDTKK